MKNDDKQLNKKIEALPTIERRTYKTALKRMEGEEGTESRTVEGYAAVFGVTTDLGWYKEVIEIGAFDEALKRSDCRALLNHDPNKLLARQSSNTLSLSVDTKGLKYEFESPGTTDGNDILIMLERGDLAESSFAFSIKKQVWEDEKIDDEWIYTRRIQEVDILYDVSPVTYPAYPDTTAAKRSLDQFKEIQKRTDKNTGQIGMFGESEKMSKVQEAIFLLEGF